MSKEKKNINKLILAGLFTALVAVGAYIKIPLPYGDYITMQFFFVILSGLVLGSFYGGLSMITYVILGLVGVPVFAGGGGFHYVLLPSFGYLIGFIVSAYVVGYISHLKKSSLGWNFLSALIGFVIIYGLGIAYKVMILYLVVNTKDALSVIILSSISFQMIKDIIMCFLASLLALRLRKSLDLR